VLPIIASSLLFLAKNFIRNKVVFDLGCGTGRFAIGAGLLGAKEVWGIDIDTKALDVARKNEEFVRKKLKLKLAQIRWLQKDIKEFEEKCDVVVQFPPFTKNLEFFRKALVLAKNRVFGLYKGDPEILKAMRRITKGKNVKFVLKKEFSYYPPWGDGMSGFKIVCIVASK
jgi:predicted RNA methylase